MSYGAIAAMTLTLRAVGRVEPGRPWVVLALALVVLALAVVVHLSFSDRVSISDVLRRR
jgi:hypothetical protein